METVSQERVLARDTRGLSTVEYVLLLVLIAAASIGAWDQFGRKLVEHVNSQATKIGDLKSTAGSNP